MSERGEIALALGRILALLEARDMALQQVGLLNEAIGAAYASLPSDEDRARVHAAIEATIATENQPTEVAH